MIFVAGVLVAACGSDPSAPSPSSLAVVEATSAESTALPVTVPVTTPVPSGPQAPAIAAWLWGDECWQGLTTPPAGSFVVLGSDGVVLGRSVLIDGGPRGIAGELHLDDAAGGPEPISVAGPTAVNAAGAMIVVGGPTSELTTFKVPGVEAVESLVVVAPELDPGYDLGWWEYGTPAVAADDSFALPAIWYQTPPDRSANVPRAYLLLVDALGHVSDPVPLGQASVVDQRLFAAATSLGVVVVSSLGELSVYELDGRLVHEGEFDGRRTVVGIAALGHGVVELQLDDQGSVSTARGCVVAA